jgi:cytoskeletal protein RodZ
MSQLMRQLQMMARERDERRREDATPPPAQNREGMSTGVKLALAGFGLLVALFVLVAVLGVGWYAYQSFSNPVATAAASESSTTQVVLAEVAPLAVAEPVTAPVENGAHPGREFVKTENGFGLLCFVGSKKICWFNASDEIAPTTPAGTKVLKVNASELNRHGIGPTTPKARAEWAELTPASWTYVVVPAATAASWRTASK